MGPLAAIGGSVLSSVAGKLLNRSGSSRTEQQQSVDLKKMVADAQEAGFNPLTVLQATGGQGWGGTSQVSSQDFDFGSILAGAALTGFADYFGGEQERRFNEAQIDLVKAQTQSFRNQVAPGVQTRAGPFVGPGNKKLPNVSQGTQMVDVAGQQMMGDYAAFGYTINPNRNISDTAIIEERYGDIVGAAYGVAVLGHDVVNQFDEVRAWPERKGRVNVTKSKYYDKADDAKKRRTFSFN